MRWSLPAVALLAYGIPSGVYAQGAAATGAPRCLGPISAYSPGCSGLYGPGPLWYRGPGDIVPAASLFWSLRAYNAAYAATGTGKSVKIRRASDDGLSDIVILTSGSFDISGYNTFVGTDTTGSCTIASTTLTCTGLGSTLHANDPISGAGIGQPCYLVAVGAFSLGAQTATIQSSSICGTISVAVTVTAQVAGFVNQVYDQTGNGRHASQASLGLQPQLLPVAGNSLPTILFAGSQYLATSVVVIPQPMTFSHVAQRTANFSSAGVLIGHTAFGTFFDTANLVSIYAGTTAVSKSATDNQLHAIQAVLDSTSSIVNVDGTDGTVGNAGMTSIAFAIGLGAQDAGVSPVTGYIPESALWPIAASAGQRNSIRANQSSFWGTP